LQYQAERPLFVQIAQKVEQGILSGAYPEEGQVPSITEFSVNYKINPATALKGINLLVEKGLLYKKRGVGMFVAQGAREALRAERAEQFYRNFVVCAVKEAQSLGVTEKELAAMVKRGFEDGNQS
jgi:DNA-binding transcriptional regulator YhcF (GntR family)